MSDSATPHRLSHVPDVDPMAHFPSEHVAEERATEHDRHAIRDAALEPDSLLAFTSETPAPVERPATADRPWTARVRVIRSHAVKAARAAAAGVSASARHLQLRAAVIAERCLTRWHAAAVQAQGTLLVVLVLAGGVCSACGRGASRTTRRCMAASRRIAGLVFLLAASLSGRARTLPAHVGTLAGSFRLSSLPRASQHAYPAALFLSGLVVGAALVALVRWPPARVVTTAAASKTQPESFAADQAPPAPAVSVTTPDRKANDHPVATKGTGATTPQHSVASASTEASPSSAPASYRGSLVINSRPQGADVFLNGRRAGTTPLVLDDVPVGSRAVRVVLKGHESWSRAFNVVANQRTTVVATLEEERDN